MSTWLITLIVVVVVVAAVLVALVARSRARQRRESTVIGLPPIGALTDVGPGAETPETSDADRGSSSPRRAAAEHRSR